MAGNVKLLTSAGGGVILDTATTTASDVTVKVPVTGVNNGTLVCSDSSGNVGIGTSSVTSGAKFQVDNPSANVIMSVGKDIPVSLFSRYNDDPALYWKSGQAMRFSTTTDGVSVAGFAERMRIDNSGNLLVGVTATTMPNAGFAFQPAQGNAKFRCGDANSFTQFYNQSNGQVGGITTNGTSTTYSTSSDYRLKENIQPMQGALATVAQLNPVTYTWKADGSDGQGFIAHELQAVVPDCVTGEKDAVDKDGKPVYQGIDTSFLVATLCKAIQELEARVKVLEAK